jgi:hypothetical protein
VGRATRFGAISLGLARAIAVARRLRRIGATAPQRRPAEGADHVRAAGQCLE